MISFCFIIGYKKSVGLQLVGTRGIARHLSTKQEQPTPERGRLALILVDNKKLAIF